MVAALDFRMPPEAGTSFAGRHQLRDPLAQTRAVELGSRPDLLELWEWSGGTKPCCWQ